jgi:hypothetical protein
VSTLADQIRECIALKKGNKEFVLHDLGDEWRAGVGNPSSHVMLGESNAQFESGWCETPEQAVWELLDLLKKHDGELPAGVRSVSL